MHNNIQCKQVQLYHGKFSPLPWPSSMETMPTILPPLCRGLYALNHGDYYLHTLHCLTRLTSLTYLCTKSVSSYRCSTPSTYVSLRTEHRDKFPGLKQYMASERARNRLPHLVELRHHLPKTEWEWQKGTIPQIRFQWAIPLWNVSWKAGDRH